MSLRDFVHHLVLNEEYDEAIFVSILQKGRGNSICSPKKLATLFAAVDDLAFDGLIIQNLKKYKLKMRFSCNSHDIKSHADAAGTTGFDHKRKLILFKMNVKLFTNLFKDSPAKIKKSTKQNKKRRTKNNNYSVGDRQCSSRIHCFVKIFLHETCHIFLYLLRLEHEHNKKQKKLKPLRQQELSHGDTFGKILHNLFHQTDSKHTLIPGFNSYGDIRKIRHDIQVGHPVLLYSGRGRWQKVKLLEVKRKEARVSHKGKIVEVPLVLLRPAKKN